MTEVTNSAERLPNTDSMIFLEYGLQLFIHQHGRGSRRSVVVKLVQGFLESTHHPTPIISCHTQGKRQSVGILTLSKS